MPRRVIGEFRQVVLLSLLAALANTLSTSPSPSLGAPPAPQPTSQASAVSVDGKSSDSLQRILKNWKARQDRTRSLRMSWDTKLPAYGAGASDRPTEADLHVLHYELWLDGDNRSRLDESFAGGGRYRRVRDGEISNTMTWRSNSARSAYGEIWSGKDAPDVTGPELAADVSPVLAGYSMHPPWMTFRPLVLLRRPKALQLIEIANVDAVRCVKIEQRDSSRNAVETLWVDPARDHLIVLRKSRISGIPFSLSFAYRQDPRGDWIPSRWTTYLGVGQGEFLVAVSTVTACTINERISDHIFTVRLPEGADVIDRRTLERYLMGKNGSKTDAVKIDSRQSLKIHEV